jgi:hypothetical protein
MRFSFRFVSTTLLAAAALAATTRPAAAQFTLLSNLEATPITGTGLSSSQSKTVAFTTGSTAYSLTSVQASLALEARQTAPATSVIGFTLYTPSVPGGDDPGTLAISLGTQNITNTDDTFTLYTFTPVSAFILAPDTRYVLQALYISGADGTWATAGGISASFPTARNGSGYSDVKYRINFSGTPFDSSVFNQFAINGITPAAAPEPGTLALLGIGGLGMVGAAARKRRS